MAEQPKQNDVRLCLFFANDSGSQPSEFFLGNWGSPLAPDYPTGAIVQKATDLQTQFAALSKAPIAGSYLTIFTAINDIESLPPAKLTRLNERTVLNVALQSGEEVRITIPAPKEGNNYDALMTALGATLSSSYTIRGNKKEATQ